MINIFFDMCLLPLIKALIENKRAETDLVITLLQAGRDQDIMVFLYDLALPPFVLQIYPVSENMLIPEPEVAAGIRELDRKACRPATAFYPLPIIYHMQQPAIRHDVIDDIIAHEEDLVIKVHVHRVLYPGIKDRFAEQGTFLIAFFEQDDVVEGPCNPPVPSLEEGADVARGGGREEGGYHKGLVKIYQGVFEVRGRFVSYIRVHPVSRRY